MHTKEEHAIRNLGKVQTRLDDRITMLFADQYNHRLDQQTATLKIKFLSQAY